MIQGDLTSDARDVGVSPLGMEAGDGECLVAVGVKIAVLGGELRNTGVKMRP